MRQYTCVFLCIFDVSIQRGNPFLFSICVVLLVVCLRCISQSNLVTLELMYSRRSSDTWCVCGRKMLVVSTEPQIHDGGTGCNPAHLVERDMEQLSVKMTKEV